MTSARRPGDYECPKCGEPRSRHAADCDLMEAQWQHLSLTVTALVEELAKNVAAGLTRLANLVRRKP